MPELGLSRLASVRSKVDFPDPLRPMIPTNSPERTVIETPRSAETLTFCLRVSLPQEPWTRSPVGAHDVVPHAEVVRHDGDRRLGRRGPPLIERLGAAVAGCLLDITARRHRSPPLSRNRGTRRASALRPRRRGSSNAPRRGRPRR